MLLGACTGSTIDDALLRLLNHVDPSARILFFESQSSRQNLICHEHKEEDVFSYIYTENGETGEWICLNLN